MGGVISCESNDSAENGEESCCINGEEPLPEPGIETETETDTDSVLANQAAKGNIIPVSIEEPSHDSDAETEPEQLSTLIKVSTKLETNTTPPAEAHAPVKSLTINPPVSSSDTVSAQTTSSNFVRALATFVAKVCYFIYFC